MPLNIDIQQIDLGEETGPRTIVSGLVHYIPIEEMRDRYLIVVVGWELIEISCNPLTGF